MSVCRIRTLATWGLVALATLGAPALAAKKPAKRVAASYSRIERSLAGIRLGTKATTLVRLFPNPVVQLGAGSGSADNTSPFGESSPFGTASPMASPSAPPMPGAPMMASPSPFPSAAGMALPPVAGGSSPFGPSGSEAGAQTTDQSGATPAVTYLYRNFRKISNFDLMVQCDEDGRVVQIIGTSPKAVPGVTTARGIGFNSSYAQIIARYGWPESHTANGNFVQVNYQESAHVAFQLLDGRVRRIVVAEVG